MKKLLKFGKTYIESFAQPPLDDRKLMAYNKKVSSIIYDCAKTLQEKSVNILDFDILFMGDSVCECETQNSEIEVLLLVNSPKIVFSTKSMFNNKFKKFLTKLRYAWVHRNDYKKLKKRKKRKKEEKQTSENQEIVIDDNKYDYNQLKLDIFKQLVDYFDESTKLYNTKEYIKIVGEELFFPIKIYLGVVIDNTIQLFDNDKYDFVKLDFAKRYINVRKKLEETDYEFKDVLRIYNNLYFAVFNQTPNTVFMESLIYNCPNELFVKDIYQTFLNVTNYICLKSISEFKSVCDDSKKLIDEELCKGCIGKFNSLKRKLVESL